MGTSKPPAIDLTLANGNTLGDPNAPITVAEFADFQCPVCGEFARQVLPQIEEKYIKTGKIKFVFNHFAFIGADQFGDNSESIRAAEASECANDQNKFWDYAHTLFNNQAGENQGAFNDASLEKFAQQIGLNMDQFKACMADRRHLDKIHQSNNYAQTHGVRGTPTLFINGAMISGYAMPDFEKALVPYLNSTR
jgi:protein-disulfide isomerase